MTYYPTREEVLEVHARVIAAFGGAPGLRDRNALEAALARPQSGYYKDEIAQAAALLESLSQNQPFVDGNKRTALTVAAAFLRVNGYRLEIEDAEAYEFLMRLYRPDEFGFDRLEEWLRTHPRRVAT